MFSQVDNHLFVHVSFDPTIPYLHYFFPYRTILDLCDIILPILVPESRFPFFWAKLEDGIQECKIEAPYFDPIASVRTGNWRGLRRFIFI